MHGTGVCAICCIFVKAICTWAVSHSKERGITQTDLCYMWHLPSQVSTCIWRCPLHHGMYLHCCMWLRHIGYHLKLQLIVFLTQCIHASTQTKTQQTGWVIKIVFRTGVAGFSLPAISTFAVEIVHQVLTRSLVQARVQAAVIYVWKNGEKRMRK